MVTSISGAMPFRQEYSAEGSREVKCEAMVNDHPFVAGHTLVLPVNWSDHFGLALVHPEPDCALPDCTF